MIALNHAAVMADLDRARTLLGNPLTVDARARIAAALEDPATGWTAARSVILRPDSLRLSTLWQCTVAANPTDGRLELAMAVPTAEQIAAGLALATR